MKRMSIHAAAFAAALAVAACGSPADDRQTTGGAAQPGAAQTARTDDNDRREFVQEAMQKNMAEIELSKLAQERAQNPQVRQFAQQMIDDHTKALNELRQIAQRENLQVNEQLPEEQRELRDKLQGLKGAEFDREYMNAMVEGHEEMHELLQDHAGERADAGRETGAVGTVGQQPGHGELTQWASRTAPIVQGHLQKAEQLRDQVGSAGRTETGDRGQSGTRGAQSPQNR